MEYNKLGDGYAWARYGDGIKWIWWVPGKPVQEGEIPYSKLSINPRKIKQPWLNRSDDEIQLEISQKALPVMRQIVARRTAKSLGEKIDRSIFADLDWMYPIAKNFSYILRDHPCQSIAFYVNKFRHELTEYDQDLAKGKDRYLSTLEHHTNLIWLIGYFRKHSDGILRASKIVNDLVTWRRLAEIDHASFVTEAYEQIQKRRV